MTNSKTTKRALFSSVVALLLCFTMLLGTTFAWFTDSASSATNKIVAGNLDVELYHADKAQSTDAAVDSNTKLFDDVTLWEPGAIVWEKLTVKNAGSLALKYNLSVNVTDISSVGGKSLADVLKVAVLTEQPTRENVASAATQSLATFNLKSDKALTAGNSDVVYVAIYWAPSANDNNYNMAGQALYANLGVTLVATQYTSESDSFDNQYDKDAEYKEPATRIATFDELKTAFANGGNVELTADIAITELVTIPAGVEVYLDMNGKTITPASANVDPLFDVKTGAALVIDGNGTFDLGELGTVNGMSLMYPRGDVTINSGTFKIATNGTKYGSMFVGINGGQGKLIINGGYFDGGYYKEGDCFNNCRNLINGSWGQYIRVYGGTFVGQNPAWGDEGMAFLCPHCTHTPGQGYCQALFLEGQSREDTELPADYTITEGTTADGRPTYTVNYSK